MPDVSGAVSQGLSWSVKTSFREYVRALDDGTERLTRGARDVDGEVMFEFAGEAVQGGHTARALMFRGSIQFEGYRGMLAVEINDPWISFGSTARLSIADPTDKLRTRRMTMANIELGTGSASGLRLTTWTGRTFLTVEGSRLFDDIYSPGTELAPVRFQAPPDMFEVPPEK